MPKLDLRNATRIKTAGGELAALKGAGFSWVKPQDISAALSLPIGQEGVTQGFSALPEVIAYTATEGRYRRGPNGFVRCAANEERLCFDSAGRFIEQAMEGPETYLSAPWHDPDAPNGPADFAYLNGDQAAIDYAGEHNEPDIFGGTGGGVVITNTATNQFHATVALRATGVVIGDVIRYEVLVAITGATGPGRIDVRGSGNPTFAFSFAHNAAGEITGMITPFGAALVFDAEYRNLGIINGKRWYQLIVWRRATGTADAAIGIGFGNVAPDAGKKFHLCDLRLVHNPQCAPSAWPVCAANKTFAADALQTTFQRNIGVLFYGGAGRCRTKITDGVIALKPDSYRRHDGFSMVTQIGVITSRETEDRVGLMPYPEMEREFAFWGGGDRTVLFGPARFAVDVDSANYPGSYANLTIGNAFTQNLLLRGWIDGRLLLSASQLTGDLTLDDALVFATCSPLNDQFEQADIRDLHFISTFGANFSAQRALFLSHPSSHSRARRQVQADDDLATSQVYMGRARLFSHNTAGITMNIADSSWQNMGRAFEPGATGANAGSRPMILNADRVFFFGNWSDDFYLGRGNWAGSSFDNQFHGGFTSRRPNLYQTRKEIEVDIGAGWQPLSATPLTETDLPAGRFADHVGTYNFDTQTLDTSTAVPGRRTIVRDWNIGSTFGIFNKIGHQFHSEGVEEGNYTRVLQVGETFVIEQIDPPSPTTPHVRFTADWGKWTDASTFSNQNTAGSVDFRPAMFGSGTHADALQSIIYDFTFDNVSSDGMVIIGDAQGVYLQGQGAASTSVIGQVDFTNFIGMTNSVYALALIEPGHGLETQFNLTNSITLPTYSRLRDHTGQADNFGNLAAPINIRGSINITNHWWANYGGITLEQFAALAGDSIQGTPNYIDIPFVINNDTWIPMETAAPNGIDFIPEAFREPQSGLPDWKLIGNPIETGFRFTEAAEIATGLPLNATLEASLVTGEFFKPLTDWLLPWQRDQDFIATVPNNAAIGTKIDVRQYQRFRPEANLPVGNVQGTSLEPRYGNPRPGLFDFDADGDLAVIGDLTGIDKLFLLKTDAGELILVDVGEPTVRLAATLTAADVTGGVAIGYGNGLPGVGSFGALSNTALTGTGANIIGLGSFNGGGGYAEVLVLDTTIDAALIPTITINGAAYSIVFSGGHNAYIIMDAPLFVAGNTYEITVPIP